MGLTANKYRSLTAVLGGESRGGGSSSERYGMRCGACSVWSSALTPRCAAHTRAAPACSERSRMQGWLPAAEQHCSPVVLGATPAAIPPFTRLPVLYSRAMRALVPGGPAPILCARQLQGTVKASNFEYSPSLMNSFLESHSSAQNSIQGKMDTVKLQTGRSYGDGSDVLNSGASQEVQRSFPFLNQAHIRFLPSWLKTKDKENQPSPHFSPCCTSPFS